MDEYFEYVNKLKFDDAPDYEHLRALLRRVFEANKFKHDFKYDWVVKREKEEEKAKLRKEKVKAKKSKAVNQKVKRNARVKMMLPKEKEKKITSVTSERPVVLKKTFVCKYQEKNNLNVKSNKFRYFY